MKVLTKEQFKAFRLRKKLSVKQMADLMGYTRDAIYKKENGTNPVSQGDMAILEIAFKRNGIK